MEELIKILEGIKPGVDYKNNKNLIEEGLLDSFDVITIVAKLNDYYDIDFTVKEVIPENFNSVEALLKTVEKLKEE